MTLNELAGAVEAAPGPSVELDEAICKALAGPMGNWIKHDYTHSLDAAVKLVPEGHFISSMHQGPSGGNWATVTSWDTVPGEQHFRDHKAKGKSLALALTAACIRALAQKGVSRDD